MRHYRVPYYLHKRNASTKAALATGMTPERLSYPDILWLEFDAPTHASAQRALQSLILHHDDRPVRGRNYVSVFGTSTELTYP